VLAARDADTIRRNAVMLPAYTLLLGLIAMLGLMAHAAGISTAHANAVVPLLFMKIFPGWFAGFAFAAIAVGALVPAAVMAVGAANLVTRNLLPRSTSQGTRPAQLTALAVKLAALGCILLSNPQFAIDLQLLGSIWVLQTLPALVLGLLRLRLNAIGLLSGWAVGMAAGSALVLADGLKPIHPLHLGGWGASVSTGLLALALNIAVALAVSAATGTATRARAG
jgi:SSS family solute:Na+ symporter